MAIKCIIVTPELQRLQQEFPKDSAFFKMMPVFKATVGAWQNKNNTEKYPTKEELISYIIETTDDKNAAFFLGEEIAKKNAKPKENADLSKILDRQEEKTETKTVSTFHKIDKLMTSPKKAYRIKLINRLFSEEVENLIKENTERLNRELAKTTDLKTKLEIAKAIKQMRPYSVIKEVTPTKIYDSVKEVFEDWLNIMQTQENAEREIERLISKYYSEGRWAKLSQVAKRKLGEARFNSRKKKYKEILDNWNEFVLEAAANYGTDWGVIIDINNNKIEEDENNIFTDDEGINKNEEFENEREESNYKEGYQIKVREISAFEGASIKLRQAIGKIQRTDWNDKVYEDDLGFPQYLQQSYVFAELITALKDMTSASQMMPLLEQLQQKKPWAKQIVRAVKNDNQLFTAFYKVFRKDYLNMWIQRVQELGDGTIQYKTQRINRASGLAHYFDEWRDNIEYGNVLNDSSIYDNNGNIIVANAVKMAKYLNENIDTYGLESNEEKQEYYINNVSILHKSLLVLGINITEDVLREVLERNVDVTNTEKKLPAEVLLGALEDIFSNIPKNKAIKNNEPADLLNLYGNAFSRLAYAINRVEEEELESSVRQGKKTFYAHTRPSYFTTLVKKLKGIDREKTLTELKEVDFLYDKNQGRWLNSILASLDDNNENRREEAIRKLEHAVVLEFNRKEYNKWSGIDTFLVLYNQFNSEPQTDTEGYGFYASPVLSDKQSAEFIRLKRYNGSSETSVLDVIADKFVDVIRQEYNRIITVKQRSKTDNKKIPNYDMTKNKKGGAKFHFLPELNDAKFNKDGKTFFEQLVEVAKDNDEFNSLSKEAARTILKDSFDAALSTLESIGIFEQTEEGKFKHFPKLNNRELVENELAKFYYNAMYAQSQIIQLLGVDLAYFKNYGDFVKRSSAFHGSTDKLNTLAKWNGEFVLADKEGNVIPERAIYLVDDERPSKHLKEIEEIIDKRIAKGELTLADKAVILDKWRNNNITDAQAVRTLKSFRATSIAADMWSDSAEEAYNNIRNNRWTAKDFIELWNTRKPYTFTQYNQSDGVGGTLRMPTIHKNSELIGLTETIFGAILRDSYKMKGLMDFMEENNIDVAMFSSAVKVGGQAPININNANSINDVQQILKDAIFDSTGEINKEVVHELDWEDYGIQVATPEHGVGHLILVGTQKRRLVGADISTDAEFDLDGKKLNREQWIAYFNALNTANIIESFQQVDKIFSDPKKISEILISEIKNNSRYSNDLIEAVTLNKDNQFNIPLFDPAQCQKFQELFNSIIRSRIVKQKINGASLILATPWCLNEQDKPQIVWDTDSKGNKRIKYIEAYVACPDERLYSLLLEEDGSINIDKKDSEGNYIVPEKYRHAIGYRIPTEAAYSLVPIRIKGFLPRQVGSVIILPDEITTIAGLDYDVDKQYVEYQTLAFRNKYDIKAALDAFYDSHPEYVIKGKRRKLDEVVKPKFQKFFNKYKDNYYIGEEVSVEEYDEEEVDFNSNTFAVDIYNQAMKNSKNQRNNKLIDLQWSLLTNSDTTNRIVNPGNFDELKRNARINVLLENLTVSDISKLGGITKVLNMTLKETEDALEKYNKIPNPLSPMTWVESQQRNMAGAELVPIAAVQNSSHSITQLTSFFGIKDDYAFTFNGRKRKSLHDTRNIDNKLISRTVGECLTAFVDNGKDPVAGDVGVNSTTHPLYFLFLRLGYSQLTAGLIMKQPAMKKILKYVGTGQYTFLDAIEKTFEDYKKIQGEIPFGERTIKHNFTDAELATSIVIEKHLKEDAHTAFSDINSNERESYREALMDFANQQMRVLVMLKKMNEAATALSGITRALRADTASGNVKSTIAASVEQASLAFQIIKSNSSEKYPLVGIDFVYDYAISSTPEEILKSNVAIPTAFNNYGLRASVQWLSNLFPQASLACAKLHDLAKTLTANGRLDAETLNKMDSQFITYLLTGYSKDFTGSKWDRDYYINKFPMEFKEFKDNNEALVQSLPLLKRLNIFYSNFYHSTPKIIFKSVGKVTEQQAEQYRSDFRNLLLNENTKEIAKKLFIYALYRGLYYRKDSYSSIIPTLVKISDITDYVPALREVLSNVGKVEEKDLGEFLNQYIRNNLNDRRFVPNVTASKVLEKEKDMPETFTVKVEKNSSKALKTFVYGFDAETKEPLYRYFVMYSRGNKNYYYQLQGETYRRITPLGNSEYQEYERGNLNPETSIREAEIKLIRDKDGKLKIPFNPNTERAADSFEASMQNDLSDTETDPLNDIDFDYGDNEDTFTPWVNPTQEGTKDFEAFDSISRNETDMEGNKPCK